MVGVLLATLPFRMRLPDDRGQPLIPFLKALQAQHVSARRDGSCSPADAKREGYSSLAKYMEAFIGINGWWDNDRLLWVIDFELVRGGE